MVRLIAKSRENQGESASRLEYSFEQDRIVIGRGRGADVRLPQLCISIHHATLARQGEQFVIIDHNSTNGTWLNGARLHPMHPKVLCTGDLVTVGDFLLVFHNNQTGHALTNTEHSAEMARRIVRDILSTTQGRIPRPKLIFTQGPQQGRSVLLPAAPARLIVGRSEHCDIPLSDADAAREHLALLCKSEGYLAESLLEDGELNINGKLLRERLLQHNDVLTVGKSSLRFEDAAEALIQELDGKEDQTLKIEPGVPATEALSPKASETAIQLPPKANVSATLDWIIYSIAAIVIGLSIVGLVLLFSNP
ncbi:MAG: FHA domain-containing protein [Myxococcales bacterium]|nr:MAG: FHA domain-containing protein [Myxococcales bacterium]